MNLIERLIEKIKARKYYLLIIAILVTCVYLSDLYLLEFIVLFHSKFIVDSRNYLSYYPSVSLFCFIIGINILISKKLKLNIYKKIIIGCSFIILYGYIIDLVDFDAIYARTFSGLTGELLLLVGELFLIGIIFFITKNKIILSICTLLLAAEVGDAVVFSISKFVTYYTFNISFLSNISLSNIYRVMARVILIIFLFIKSIKFVRKGLSSLLIIFSQE